MTTDSTGQACACCVPDPANTNVLEQIGATATRLGIDGDDRQQLLAVADTGDCRTTRELMADQVNARLSAAQERIVQLIEHTAATHASSSQDDPGMPQPVADLHVETVTALDSVARLQAAAARLGEEPDQAACTTDCPCATAGDAHIDTPRVPASRAGLQLVGPESDPAIACTLDGGLDAMRTRMSDWQRVIGQATSRHGIEGGVTLTYDHDEQVTVELARLAAAEFACCSFFQFSLTVGPTGMAFTVTAPDEARDVVTAVFGTFGASTAGAQ